MLDGVPVAWRNGEPFFPWIARRVLHGDRSVPLNFVILDVLRLDGRDITREPLHKRRTRLERLNLRGGVWTTPETFDDGEALYAAVCEQGLEGVVANAIGVSTGQATAAG